MGQFACKVGRRKHIGTEIRVGLNPSLTLTPYMTLSESLVLLKSQFHHLQNEGTGKKSCLPSGHEDAKRNVRGLKHFFAGCAVFVAARWLSLAAVQRLF